MTEPGTSGLNERGLELNKPVDTILKEISGQRIEQKLIDLAEIGGNIKEIGKDVAVSRLALSKEDLQARVFLETQMKEAGMQVKQHPMGLIGIYPGEDPNLPAVMLMSHFDSVPNGGMYDGTVGVISSIEVVRLLHENKIRLPRSIIVLPVTAEESSRFNIALMGSKAMFQGLTDADSDNRRPGDQSLREALAANGFNPADVKSPRFKPTEISECIELHVSQNGSLEQHGKDLAVIEAIAAPARFELTIGNPIEPDTQEPPNAKYMHVSVVGQSDHTGATPMGAKNRADALWLAVRLTKDMSNLSRHFRATGKDIDISIGGLSIENQSLNKIPGKVDYVIRVGGKDVKALKFTMDYLQTQVMNKPHQNELSPYKVRTVEIKESEKPKNETFYKAADIMPRHALTAEVIEKIDDLAEIYQLQKKKNIVGTVSTFHLNANGQIILGIDIRGTNIDERNAVTREMEDAIEKLSKGPYTYLVEKEELNKSPHLTKKIIYDYSDDLVVASEGPEVNYELKKLPGSSDPTLMDKSLVTLAEEIIKKNSLGSYETTFSPAGHDAQNAARAGIPTVMIFIPSRNGGASHTPQEYSTPEDLERGTKALAALTMELASKN